MTDVLSSAEDCARDGAAGDQEALALAQRAGAGDRSAQSDLLARVVSSVHARVRSLMRNRADVDDAAQESLVEILVSAGSYRGEGSFAGWCDRITVRTTKRRLRKDARKLKLVDPDAELEAIADVTPVAPLRDGLPGEVQRLLNDLSIERYQALELRAMGYSVEEIAKRSRVSVNTVKDRLRMARRQLRRAIRQQEVLAEIGRARPEPDPKGEPR
ncbi:MAG: RNA polymerase sigma factor [Myxococcales bacterium]|nr:RNA polymerase sigma factor [Myxococcales bacterium]